MKKARLWIVAFAVALMIHIFFDRTLSHVFFYAGFPGMFTSLLITGGHGGTIDQETFARVWEVAINTICYFGLLAFATTLWKRTRS